jgi:hypothetical protein
MIKMMMSGERENAILPKKDFAGNFPLNSGKSKD